jgi:hypothetical protein
MGGKFTRLLATEGQGAHGRRRRWGAGARGLLQSQLGGSRSSYRIACA